MNNKLNEYRYLKKILILWNNGVNNNLVKENLAYDGLLDYMDSVWFKLTEGERNSLRMEHGSEI